MARTVHAVPYIDPIYRIAYITNSIVSEMGFYETVCDDEKVWCRENDRYGLTEFIKYDYETDVFIFSAWIKLKNDADSYREYDIDYFGVNAKETEILTEIVRLLYERFGGNLTKKEFYVWEKNKGYVFG